MATDGTSYLIELSAKFGGGEAAATKLATLGDRMMAAGANAKQFEDATKAASSALEHAATAAKSAADAVADGNAKYAAAETAANKAAMAVESIGAEAQKMTGRLANALEVGDAKAIERAENKIWELAQRQQEATEASRGAASALKVEAAALDALNAKATTATTKHTDLKAGLANVETAAAKAAKAEKDASGSGKVNEMAEAFGKLGGPAGVAGQKVLGMATGFTKLKASMGAAGPYAAVAVAIVAIATAAFLAATAVTTWGVKLADTNRTQGLLMDGIARTSAGGAELADTIDRLGNIVPSTREELMGMASTLANTGLRGKELSTQLEATAIKAAKLKFGPDFEAQMLSLDFQSKRLSENLASTFGGLQIDGLLEGMQTLGKLFDSSTASGKALKFLFESMFQPLVDGATDVIPKIERMFLYAEILALKAFIATKPYHNAIMEVGKAALIAAAILGGVLAVSIALAIAPFAAAFAVILALTYVLYQLGRAAYAIGEALVRGLIMVVKQFVDIGGQIIDGLVSGITGKAHAVVDALTSTVSDGVKAVEKFLMIGSPSKLMMGIGADTAEGFTGGVEGAAGDASGALEAMVAPPEAGGGAGARAGGGGLSLSIGQIIVSGENAKEQANDFIEQITKWLEGEGITLGGGEVPA